MQCDGLAKNGKRCEREAHPGNRGPHGNKWCACGQNEKHSGQGDCVKCHTERVRKRSRGEGPSGLIGRFRRLLYMAKRNARNRKFKPPNITAEELVVAWERQGGSRNDLSKPVKCAGTDRLITLYEAVVEHNHETGEFRGFVCSPANSAEGYLSNVTLQEGKLFIERFFPEIAALIRASDSE